ncbi:MAG: hypothetical protein A2341_01205 [Deltaproteobacteria bacterium RIFOXYB12_FULL_58_9]|nr:MAG: hypothetical protein A2341_01205 [Deltaproteobacteria bacterium RIFOXYB12_FULL_58_9]
MLDDDGLAKVVAAARRVLADDGIIVFPTESFYGIGVRADSRAAVERLVRAKSRDADKPIPLIAATRVDVSRIGPMPDLLEPLAAEFWPGPLTMAIPVADLAVWPESLSAGTGTIGVRVSGHGLAVQLAALAGGLITASSANPAGGTPPLSPAGLAPELTGFAGLIVDGGLCAGGLPSTVVAVRDGVVAVLREGAIARAVIEQAIERAGGRK